MVKQWFVVFLYPTDTVVVGPFLTSVRAENWALKNAPTFFQIKQVVSPYKAAKRG
jgi:hypothetical protein